MFPIAKPASHPPGTGYERRDERVASPVGTDCQLAEARQSDPSGPKMSDIRGENGIVVRVSTPVWCPNPTVLEKKDLNATVEVPKITNSGVDFP